MINIENNLLTVKKLIGEYERKYDRIPGSVHLLAVSKGQSIEKIAAAFNAGQHAFGENYLQEALTKINALADKPIEWHFIGPIQSNKTKKIAEHFAFVQSVASLKIAERLNEQRPPHLPPLNICIQVNVSNELAKSGVNIDEAESLIRSCFSLPKLKVRGLMTVPAFYDDFADQRKEFHKLFLLWQTLCSQGFTLDTLSMGMSDDFAAAIAEGATLIRIGTRIFGERLANET